MKYLGLYFSAPFQSWGISSEFTNRDSFDFPTKSAVIGILAASCGIDRCNKDWVASISNSDFFCESYSSNITLLSDFQTIGGGYDKNDSFQKKFIPVKAENGKPRANNNTVLLNKTYLQDASFGVAISIFDSELAETIASNLNNPIWGVWLGRKSCVPCEPILVGLFESFEDAFVAVRGRHSARTGVDCGTLIKMYNSNAILESDEVVKDIPLSFIERKFATRLIVREIQDDI